MAKNAVLKAEKSGKKPKFLIATGLGLGLVVLITGLLFFRFIWASAQIIVIMPMMFSL